MREGCREETVIARFVSESERHLPPEKVRLKLAVQEAQASTERSRPFSDDGLASGKQECAT